MLLCGSFQNQVVRLINMFRFDEKQLSRSKNSEPEMSSTSDLEEFRDLKADYGEDEIEEEDTEVGEDGANLEADTKGLKRKDWRRVRKIYERSKQYIFVAATLPENGKRTAGGVLKRMFPDARWVSGNYLHQHSPRCHFYVSFSPLFSSLLVIPRRQESAIFSNLITIYVSVCMGRWKPPPPYFPTSPMIVA